VLLLEESSGTIVNNLEEMPIFMILIHAKIRKKLRKTLYKQIE